MTAALGTAWESGWRWAWGVGPGLAGITAIGLFLVTGAAGVRSRSRPGGAVLAVLSATLVAVTASVSAWQLELVSPDAVRVPVTAGLVVPPLLWAVFVFEYTGRGPPITRGWATVFVGLGVVAGISSVLAAGVDLTDPGVVGQASLTLTLLSQVAVFALGLLGVFLIARAALTYDDLPRLRAAALIVGGLGVTLLPFWWLFAQTISEAAILALTLGQLLVTGGAFVVAEIRGLFADRPLTGHLARETILDTMRESVVIVGQQGRILDANERASDTFGIQQAQLPDRRITADVGLDPDDAGERTVLETDRGPREFEVSRTSLADARGSPVGQAYRLRDVTDEHTQEQKLTVFNRILRHNLRNDLDAIRGFAEAVRADGDGGDAGGEADAAAVAEHGTRITDISAELVELTGQLERANEVLTERTPTTEDCNLAALAETVADRARSRVDRGSISVSVSAAGDPVEIATDPEILQFALAELVTNGLEHATDPDPAVEIVLVDRPTGALVEIRDDGPGLPANERAVLLDGEETPLRHGGGIGLWTVRWAVKRLGGELAVADRDPTGTTVSVTIPDDRAPD